MIAKKEAMVFFMGKMFLQEACNPINRMLDLFLGKTAPDNLHQPIIRKLLKIDDKGSLIYFFGEPEGHRPPIGLHEPMRILFHATPFILSIGGLSFLWFLISYFQRLSKPLIKTLLSFSERWSKVNLESRM
jgi:hypothetical protein